jgi:kumamolisin
VFSQLSGNGTTLFASSGDQGAGLPTCDGKSLMKAASTPATDPKVTAVGGTDLTATAPTFDSTNPEVTPGGQYESETVWNDGVKAAEGAGISGLYARPGFQNSVASSPATGWETSTRRFTRSARAPRRRRSTTM